MFVVVYRWRIDPAREAAFRDGWSRVTAAYRERHGSLGSALFRSGAAEWVAIARWPDRATRERAFAAGSGEPEALAAMRSAIVEAFADLELDAVEDQWVAATAAAGSLAGERSRVSDTQTRPESAS